MTATCKLIRVLVFLFHTHFARQSLTDTDKEEGEAMEASGSTIRILISIKDNTQCNNDVIMGY